MFNWLKSKVIAWAKGRRLSDWIVDGMLLTAWAAIFIAIVAGVHSAQAADRADEVQAYPPENYCRYIGSLFYYGVKRHNDGAPHVYKPWPGTDENPAEPTADDGLYIREWNSMTPHEKQFIAKHISNGWQWADETVKKDKDTKVDPDVSAYRYYVACMEAKALEYGKKHKDLKQIKRDIIKVQSENMVSPDMIKRRVCDSRRNMAAWIIGGVRRGVSKDHFWAMNPLPENWSDEAKALARRIVDDAFVWPRGEQDYVDQVGRDCEAEKW
jgi:hypothetical protein